MQEVGIPVAKRAAAQGRARNLGFSAVFSPTDPEQSDAQAGVGVVTKLPGQVRELKMRSPEGLAGYSVGRLIKATVRTASGLTYNLLVAYGYAGASTDAARNHRTDCLMTAARLEQGLDKHGATFTCVDLNNDLLKVPTVAAALEEGDWFDVASYPHLQQTWESSPARQQPEQQRSQGVAPTCWAHGGKASDSQGIPTCEPKRYAATSMARDWCMGPV